jgi:carbonic anhydrase
MGWRSWDEDKRKSQPTTLSPSLRFIVDRVRPSVEKVLSRQESRGTDELLLARAAVRANVHASVDQLRQASPVLRELIRAGTLTVAGAEYSVETGVVEFLDGSPEND